MLKWVICGLGLLYINHFSYKNDNKKKFEILCFIIYVLQLSYYSLFIFYRYAN